MAPLKVGVIGAGLAGIRAADILQRAGVEVKVLEARNRIGGRTTQSYQLGTPVDLGANWIHGINGNPIYEIAQTIPGSTYEQQDNIAFTGNGERIDAMESEAIQTAFWETVAYGQEFSKRYAEYISPASSFYEFCQLKAKHLYDESTPRNYERFMALCELWGAFVGSDVRTQSLKFFFLEELLDGPTVFVASTYGPILDIVSKSVRDAGLVQLDTPVKKVHSKDGRNGRREVEIKTASGDSLMFDAVLVTVPLGCLKKESIQFVPSLPLHVLEGIRNIGYGQLEKAYVSFENAWWEKDSVARDNFIFLSDWKHDHPPAKVGHCVFICALSQLSTPYNQPTLLFYFYGKLSQKLVSLPDGSVPEGKRALIEFLKPYYSQIPGFLSNAPECEPLEIVRTNWSNDELAGNGSYSNFQVGLANGVDSIEAMRAGVEDQNLWFAGEHVAPLVGLGTAAGAYWSGELAAKKILRKFNIDTKGLPSSDLELQKTSNAGPETQSAPALLDNDTVLLLKLCKAFAPGAPSPSPTTK